MIYLYVLIAFFVGEIAGSIEMSLMFKKKCRNFNFNVESKEEV